MPQSNAQIGQHLLQELWNQVWPLVANKKKKGATVGKC